MIAGTTKRAVAASGARFAVMRWEEGAGCINVMNQDLAPFRCGLGGVGIKGRSHSALPGPHPEVPKATQRTCERVRGGK
jgi:hypothetical protein